jgi:hypothetical protein
MTVEEPEGTPPARGRTVRQAAVWVLTALACLLVFFALVAPNRASAVTPGAFLRLPVEALVGAALMLGLPARARRIVAALVGAALGVLTVFKVVDMGFYGVLQRPFDPVLDRSFFGSAVDVVAESAGRAGAIAAVVGAVVLAVAVPVLMTLSVLRLSGVAARHRTATTRGIAALTVVWVGCAAFSLPLAARSAASLTYEHISQIGASLRDRQAFVAEAADDAFRNTPGTDLLTALRGNDVLFTFVESYGRDAVENPELAPQIDALLDDGTRRLRAAGFGSRSAFLTSPTVGGASWLAHGTLQSGVWIDNQQRYRNLVSSGRLTLASAFERADWRTVAVMPATTRAWPEGALLGFERNYDDRNLGYKGPRFAFGGPDQFTLTAFQRAERATPGRAPVMAEIDLVSSHGPWLTAIPRMVDWSTIGDGTVYASMVGDGESADGGWRGPARVRAEYRRSIEYSLSSVISYVETYGDDNLVLVFLGDHQPAPIITGENASRDVPITIVARDTVLDRLSGWGWQDGLNPGPDAPVWRMSAFRDKFLAAYR